MKDYKNEGYSSSDVEQLLEDDYIGSLIAGEEYFLYALEISLNLIDSIEFKESELNFKDFLLSKKKNYINDLLK